VQDVPPSCRGGLDSRGSDSSGLADPGGRDTGSAVRSGAGLAPRRQRSRARPRRPGQAGGVRPRRGRTRCERRCPHPLARRAARPPPRRGSRPHGRGSRRAPGPARMGDSARGILFDLGRTRLDRRPGLAPRDRDAPGRRGQVGHRGPSIAAPWARPQDASGTGDRGRQGMARSIDRSAGRRRRVADLTSAGHTPRLDPRRGPASSRCGPPPMDGVADRADVRPAVLVECRRSSHYDADLAP
jgi:hypothetical protein